MTLQGMTLLEARMRIEQLGGNDHRYESLRTWTHADGSPSPPQWAPIGRGGVELGWYYAAGGRWTVYDVRIERGLAKAYTVPPTIPGGVA